MQENIIIDDSNRSDGFQLIITEITWNTKTTKTYQNKKKEEELPRQFTLDLPDNVLKQANKQENNFNDIVETFVYNFLTRKFNHEVYSCSIWLPLKNNEDKQ